MPSMLEWEDLDQQILLYNSGNGNMYMTDEGSGSVYIINSANSVIDTINEGNGQGGVAYNSDDGNVYDNIHGTDYL